MHPMDPPLVIYFHGETSVENRPCTGQARHAARRSRCGQHHHHRRRHRHPQEGSRSPSDRSRRWARSVSASAPTTGRRRSTSSFRSPAWTTSSSAAGTSSKRTATRRRARPACSNAHCSIRFAASWRPSSRCPAVFDRRYVKRLDGPNVKKGKNKKDLADQLDRRHPQVQEDARLRPAGDDLVRQHRGLHEGSGRAPVARGVREGPRAERRRRSRRA